MPACLPASTYRHIDVIPYTDQACDAPVFGGAGHTQAYRYRSGAFCADKHAKETFFWVLHTCSLRTGVASALLQQLHKQLILQLWSLESLVQQLLHNLYALGCSQAFLTFIHVPLNPSKHFYSTAGVVSAELQQ